MSDQNPLDTTVLDDILKEYNILDISTYEFKSIDDLNRENLKTHNVMKASL